MAVDRAQNPCPTPDRWQSGRLRQIANLLTGFFPVRGFESRPVRQLLRPSASVLWVVLLLALPACVTRKLTIRSEPLGAQVILDGRVVGTTPYEETFLSYGVRRLELRLSGFDTKTIDMHVSRPWWQVFPFSLFTDVLLPVDIHDDRDFAYQLSLTEQITDRVSAEDAARAAYLRLKEQRTAASKDP
jgi:hypothetical protein